MPIPWNEDPPGSEDRIRRSIEAVLEDIARHAPDRHTPTVAMAREWHRRLCSGVPLPVPYYAGEVRDSDPACPELYGYEVIVGNAHGVPAAQVPAELEAFEDAVRRAVAVVDERIPPGSRPQDQGQLYGIAQLAAYVHGEWVRIHPFANGNGRTARLWANWIALRYGLPPFVRLKPRPEGALYRSAAAASMRGDHNPMATVLLAMLASHLP